MGSPWHATYIDLGLLDGAVGKAILCAYAARALQLTAPIVVAAFILFPQVVSVHAWVLEIDTRGQTFVVA
jgi:hypothetical protein